MSGYRGAHGGANKPRSHNVNSVYAGKNTLPLKASGPGKHGLQTLGKATAVVRRMPPPATLPSLKAEHGQDPNVAIVPHGGTGWTKSVPTTTPKAAEAAKQNGSTDAANAPDLRPTWAKSSSGSGSESTPTSTGLTPLSAPTAASNLTAATSGKKAAQINRDFPSLAASAAAAAKTDANTLKKGWSDETPLTPIMPPQQLQTGGYIGASTAPKPNVDRKLPERYFASTQSLPGQSRGTAKLNIREKLARISLKAKESAAAAQQASNELFPLASKQQSDQPKTSVNIAVPSASAPVSQAAPSLKPAYHAMPQQPLAVANRSSQDVRQIHASHFGHAEPTITNQIHQQQHTQEWNQPPQQSQAYHNGGYENDKQVANGRVAEGYGNAHSHIGPPQGLSSNNGAVYGGGQGVVGGFGGPSGQPQYDDPRQTQTPPHNQPQHSQPPRGYVNQRPIEQDLGWGDELLGDGRHNGPLLRNNSRYRMDSRSSTDTDGWHANPQYPPQRRSNGPPSSGWYDNSGYSLVPPSTQDYQQSSYQNFGPHPHQTQHSRDNSIAAPTGWGDYFYPKAAPPPLSVSRRHAEDYRYNCGSSGDVQSGYNVHSESEQQPVQQQHSQSYSRQQVPPPMQPMQRQSGSLSEMPYRMLKRNDEKSAEFLAHHGGAPIQASELEAVQIQQAKSVPIKKDKLSQGAAIMFNKLQADGDKHEEPVAEGKADTNENVWAKRAEERKKQAHTVTKTNSRYQRELDSNFPSIGDVPKTEINEWSSNNVDHNNRHNQRSDSYGNRRNDQRRREKSQQSGGADVVGATHWVQHNNGPSWDNLTIPGDHRNEILNGDDEYTGTKREFVNSKRSRGGSALNGRSEYNRESRRPSKNTKVGPVKKISPPVGNKEAKKLTQSEDNFSNMGEFHAEDYKTEDGRQYDLSENRRGKSSRRSQPGSSRPYGPKNGIHTSAGDDVIFEESNNHQANGDYPVSTRPRRGAPSTLGNARGGSRFLAKHANKPPRHKGSYTSTIVSGNSLHSPGADGEGLKSPMVSEGMDDEWETASESSDIADRSGRNDSNAFKPLRPERRSGPLTSPGLIQNVKKVSTRPPEINGSSTTTLLVTTSTNSTTRAGQKNVKPASHTYPGNGAFVRNNNASNRNTNNDSNSNNNSLASKRVSDAAKQPGNHDRDSQARNDRKGQQSGTAALPILTHNNKDGLAGVDINDASVIVIDDRPDFGRDESYFEAGDFEEVLSKKQRKQRQLQQEEERRRQEKLEKIAAKRTKVLERKRNEKFFSKSARNFSTTTNSEPAITNDVEKAAISATLKPDLGTSVWNSVYVAMKIADETMTPTHIPSPIARPTKSCDQAASPLSLTSETKPPTAENGDFNTFNGSSSTVTASSSYDFTFDPKLKETAPSAKTSQQLPPSSSQDLFEQDHAQLKEKLDKVKDFWPANIPVADVKAVVDEQQLGPNVAKVKPQPQQQDGPTGSTKTEPPKTIAASNGEASSSSACFSMPSAPSPNVYRPSGGNFFPMPPAQSPFSNHGIMCGANEFSMTAFGASSPPPSSFFGLLSGNAPIGSSGRSFENVFGGGMWGTGLDFLTGNNPTPPLASNMLSHGGPPSSVAGASRYAYGTNSRPSSRPSMTPGHNMGPPSSMGFSQRGANTNGFIPTHLPPPMPQPPFMDFVTGGPVLQPQAPVGSSLRYGNPGQNYRQGTSQQTTSNHRNHFQYPPPQATSGSGSLRNINGYNSSNNGFGQGVSVFGSARPLGNGYANGSINNYGGTNSNGWHGNKHYLSHGSSQQQQPSQQQQQHQNNGGNNFSGYFNCGTKQSTA